MDGHGLPVYVWVANQKQDERKINEDKKSLLNNDIKALFTEYIDKEAAFNKKTQDLKGNNDEKEENNPKHETDMKNKEIMAYFHGKTKDGYAYTLKGIYLHAEGRVYKGGMANSKANSQGVF